MDVSASIRSDDFSLTATAEHAISALLISAHEDSSDAMTLQEATPGARLPNRDDADRDIDVILASFGLQSIRRYMNQVHWHEESRLAQAADDAEPGLKLENVAAHSWHVADAILLLAPNFPEVDVQHALELAIVHDKLELITGDFDPVGPEGDGSRAHAFDHEAQATKTELELNALEHYLAQLRPAVRDYQRALILESIYLTSPESRMVKAVDKLQALSFVLAKKGGGMTNEHLIFSIRYSAKIMDYFPNLTNHYLALVSRLVRVVATFRSMSPSDLIADFPVPVKSVLAAADD